MGQTPNDNKEFIALRKLAGVLCFVIGLGITLLDAISPTFEVNSIVLVIVFSFGAAMFGVPLPNLSINLPFLGGGKKDGDK